MNQLFTEQITSDRIKLEIKERMGVVPSFFLIAEETPEIMESLWQQAKTAYLDNPLPSMFKEKLFAYVSRFCSAPYCMARHSAFLMGRGRIAGDSSCMPLRGSEVVELLARPTPSNTELLSRLEWLSGIDEAVEEIVPGSELERALLDVAALLFVDEFHSGQALVAGFLIESSKQELTRILGRRLYHHLVVFLSFIRSAHSWTKLHKDIGFEPDLLLLDEQQDLANWIASCEQVVESESSGRRQDSFAEMRQVQEDFKSVILDQSRFLEQEQATFQQIFAGVNCIAWKCEADTMRFVYVSPSAEKILGYPAECWTDAPDFWPSLINQMDREDALQSCVEWTRKGMDHQFQYRMTHADGRTVWIEDFVRLVRNENGDVTHLQGLMVDITAQKEAERQARQSERRLKALFETQPECVKILDADGCLLEMNPAGLAMIDAESLGQVQGKSVLPLICREYHEVFNESIRKAFAGDHTFLEFEVIGLGGRRIWMESFASPLRDDDGNVVAQLAVTRDITDRKLAHSQLIAQNAMTESLLATTLDGYVLADSEGNLIDVNQSYCDLLGYDRETLLGMKMDQIEARPGPEVVQSRIARVAAKGRDRFETQHRHRDGHSIDVDVSIVVLDRLPNSPLFAAFVRDVTEQKRSAEALKESESRFRAMFEQAAVGVGQIDSRTGAFVRINQRYSDIVGYSIEELLSSDFQSITHPDDLPPDLENMRRLLVGEIHEFTMEKRYRRKDGNVVWVALTVSPLWNPGEEPDFHIAVVQDITARIIALESLKASKSQLRELNRELERRIEVRTVELKDKNQELEGFAHSVSHDLRAPLRAMEGFAAALAEDYHDQLGTNGLEFVQHIRESANRMDELVHDLLSYSQLGKTELGLGAIELDGVARKALVQLEAIIKERNAEIEVGDDLLTVSAHRTTLVQIIANLVANSIKFTTESVQPKIRISSERRENGQVRLSIRDNGIGIAKEDQQRIFMVFERLHGVESYPGTGIGLAIVARGCERLGGRCGVISKPGTGSEFWIEFPEGESA